MTERALAVHRDRPSRPEVVATVSGNHLLSRFQDLGDAESFDEPDPVLATLAEGGTTEIRARASYAELEREVHVLREKVKKLSAALDQKTAELDELGLERPSFPGRAPALDAAPPSSRRVLDAAPPSSRRVLDAAPPSSRRSLAPTRVPSSLAPPRLSVTSMAPPRLSSPSFALAPGMSIFRSLALTVIEPEQREHSRTPCSLDVEFTVESEFYTGITQDLSQGGLFVVTYSTFPLDTELSLRIELRTGEVVEVKGRVRWLREPHSESTRPGMGIEFVALPEDALESIQRSCRGREPLFFDVAALP